jgi:hypothetical protein
MPSTFRSTSRRGFDGLVGAGFGLCQETDAMAGGGLGPMGAGSPFSSTGRSRISASASSL